MEDLPRNPASYRVSVTTALVSLYATLVWVGMSPATPVLGGAQLPGADVVPGGWWWRVPDLGGSMALITTVSANEMSDGRILGESDEAGNKQHKHPLTFTPHRPEHANHRPLSLSQSPSSALFPLTSGALESGA